MKTNMTYMQAITMLKKHPTGPSSDGSSSTNLIRRAAWDEKQIMVLTNGQAHLAEARVNPSTKRHMAPEIQRLVTSCEDLWSTDWEFVEANAYF